jgi:CheY-like chemotaxis protein
MTDPFTDTTVMVVGNYRTTLKSVCEYLEKMDIHPLLAENGSEAISTYSREYPDIVLIDDTLPDMETALVAEKIRSMERNRDWTAIIFLTSINNEDDLMRMLHGGDNSYLIKPVSEFVLKTKLISIQHLLKMKSMLMELTCKINYASHLLNQLTDPDKYPDKSRPQKSRNISLH